MSQRINQTLARIGITIGAISLFLLIRTDVSSGAKRYLTAEMQTRLKSPRIIANYLRNNAIRKLQLGAGGIDKPGWLNTDIEPLPSQAFLDASKTFPLPDGSFKYVFSEQVIEHLTYEQGMVMLKESYRVLQPGGVVRIATPNLLQFLALFRGSQTKEMEKYIRVKMAWHEWPITPDQECYILNLQLREWGHQFVYTPKLLRANLAMVGFKNIKEFRTGESDNPDFKNVEDRVSWITKDVDAYETMVFEGVRPN